MDETTKMKIRQVVSTYKTVQPQEYALVVEQIKQTRGMQYDEFASTGEDHVIEQKIYEIPETLHMMLKNSLSDQQKTELKTKQGARWFAKAFPEFATALKI